MKEHKKKLEKFESLWNEKQMPRKGGGYFPNTELFGERPEESYAMLKAMDKERGAALERC